MKIFYRLGTWLFGRDKGRHRPTHARLTLEALEDRVTPATNNAIIAENLLAGAPITEWGISGSGDPTLQGFATNMSVNQGETVQFKINDPSLAAYHIDI